MSDVLAPFATEALLPGEPRDLPFHELVRGRASVRQLQARSVAPDLVRQCIAAAGWAPSPHGRQPWRFAVLTEQPAKARLAAAMGTTWQEQLALDGQSAEVVATRKRKSEARIVGAPVVIVPCLYLADLDQYPDAMRQAAETTMAIQSLGAAIQNLLLQAYVLGLDTGWMCAPLFCPEVVARALDLTNNVTPHALLTLGYRAADPQRRPRRPLDELIVHWE